MSYVHADYGKRIVMMILFLTCFGVIVYREIDKEEFKKVMALMRAQNRQGAVHRDGLRPGLKVHGSVENGGLVEHFFGKDGKAHLRHDKFVQFMRDLNNEVNLYTPFSFINVVD